MDMQRLQDMLADAGVSASNNPIVSFKAGILNIDGTKITADPRQGKIALLKKEGLLHFQWRLRPSDDVKNDVICMPNDAKFEPVEECKDGRVFFLDFKGDKSRRQFFWMQEADKSKDASLIKKVNDALSGKTSTSTDTTTGGNDTANSQTTSADYNHLIAMLSGQPESGSSSTDSSATHTTTSASASTTAAPASISTTATSASTTTTTTSASSSASSSAAPQEASTSNTIDNVPLSLSGVLDADLVLPLLTDDDSVMEALLPELPPAQRTPSALREQLRSPQMQQSMERLSAALNSGQAAPLLHQLGLPNTGDIGVEALIRALQEQANAKRGKK